MSNELTALVRWLIHASHAKGMDAGSRQHGLRAQASTPLVLWPSKTPGQMQKEQKVPSPGLGSLSRPSARIHKGSAQSSREGKDTTAAFVKPSVNIAARCPVRYPDTTCWAGRSVVEGIQCRADNPKETVRLWSVDHKGREPSAELWSPGLPRIARADPVLTKAPITSGATSPSMPASLSLSAGDLQAQFPGPKMPESSCQQLVTNAGGA